MMKGCIMNKGTVKNTDIINSNKITALDIILDKLKL